MSSAKEIVTGMSLPLENIDTAAHVERSDSALSKPGLVTKLAQVMGELKRVPKRGRNSFLNYDYVTEGDLCDALRTELSERHIFIFPDVIDIKRTPHEIETMKGLRKTQLTEVMVRWTFVDGDTGEMRDVTMPGIGEDNNDKGFYKSITGSLKYLLLKSFLISTGDDPEAETRGDAHDAKEKAKAAGAQVLAKKKELIAARAGPTFEPEGLYLAEYGDGFVALSGGGLTILRAEMTKEKAETLGLKKHPEKPALAIMPIEWVFKLEDFCTNDLKPPVKMHWSDPPPATVRGTTP